MVDELTINDPGLDLLNLDVKSIGDLLVLDHLCRAASTQSSQSVELDLANKRF
jgi:hypothetical protein